jgi:hypothetical protein
MDHPKTQDGEFLVFGEGGYLSGVNRLETFGYVEKDLTLSLA